MEELRRVQFVDYMEHLCGKKGWGLDLFITSPTRSRLFTGEAKTVDDLGVLDLVHLFYGVFGLSEMFEDIKCTGGIILSFDLPRGKWSYIAHEGYDPYGSVAKIILSSLLYNEEFNEYFKVGKRAIGVAETKFISALPLALWQSVWEALGRARAERTAYMSQETLVREIWSSEGNAGRAISSFLNRVNAILNDALYHKMPKNASLPFKKT